MRGDRISDGREWGGADVVVAEAIRSNPMDYPDVVLG